MHQGISTECECIGSAHFAEGVFGDIYIRVNNLPSPDNPATSYLAALSILSLLNNLEEPLVVGT